MNSLYLHPSQTNTLYTIRIAEDTDLEIHLPELMKIAIKKVHAGTFSSIYGKRINVLVEMMIRKAVKQKDDVKHSQESIYLKSMLIVTIKPS